MKEAAVTSKGQVTIPVAIRKALGLENGGKVLFALDENGECFLRKKSRSIMDMAGIIKTDISLTDEEIKEAIAEGYTERFKDE